MKNKKTVYFLYEPYECSALEEYFEAMAETGWLIKSMNRPFFRFERIEPKKLKFSVDILNKISSYDPDDSDDALDYREYCEAAGWKYVCQDKKIQVFYTEDYNSTIDIHTDESEKFKSVVKASLGNMFSYLFIVLLWGFNIKTQFRGDISDTLTSNSSIALLVLMCVFIIMYASNMLNFVVWMLKARKRIKKNEIMPYNNYKQLRLKNRILATHGIICVMSYIFFVFNDSKVNGSGGVIFSVMFFSVVIGSIFVTRYIRKKRYSRQTNFTLAIGGGVAYIFIFLALIGVLLTFGNLDDYNKNKVPKDKLDLVFSDFGYDENNDDNLYINYSKSVVAEKIHYSNNDEDNRLSYTILESKYHWVINLQEERLIEWLSKFIEDLKPADTNFPTNIKVYSDKNKETYILVSKDKVVELNKNFSDISEEEFLKIVYEKILKES